MKNNLKEIILDFEHWEEIAENHTKWRRAAAQGCEIFEVKTLAHVELKQGLQKGIVKGLDVNLVGWRCEVCERILLSKAGYVNHLESHERKPSHAVQPFATG